MSDARSNSYGTCEECSGIRKSVALVAKKWLTLAIIREQLNAAADRAVHKSPHFTRRVASVGWWSILNKLACQIGPGCLMSWYAYEYLAPPTLRGFFLGRLSCAHGHRPLLNLGVIQFIFCV